MDVPGLKDGVYKIQGAATAQSWEKVCQTLGVPAKGGAKAEVYLDVAGPVIRARGSMEIELEQVCVRTLEPFMLGQHITFSETLTRGTRTRKAEEADDDDTFVIEGDTFDVGDFLTQHIVLNLDPHPIKDPSSRGVRGGLVLSDGLDEVVKQEKNPFSVLKQLKS
jgi:uncharacterized metal-binding protein YceD (DUF177 family)